jgi:hypothetical protein
MTCGSGIQAQRLCDLVALDARVCNFCLYQGEGGYGITPTRVIARGAPAEAHRKISLIVCSGSRGAIH